MDWIGATSDNQPLQTVVQLVNGSVNDRSVIAVNGDLFYQSLEPGIRSLLQAVRYFNQWGNIQISNNELRVLQFNDRALLRFASGVYFDNRMLQTALPRQTDQGVVHDALIPMDFVPASSFGAQKPPNWEGIYQGIAHMQLFYGNFGGRERAFSVVRSEKDGGIDLWELTIGERFEFTDQRVLWQMEFPAFTWGKEFDLKKLVGCELWIDRIVGRVDFTMEWRADGETCWHKWHEWFVCTPRNTAENCNEPITYPVNPTELGPSFRQTMTLPKPPDNCVSATGRPAHIAYQIQPRLTIKGFARVRAILLHAEPYERKLYAGLTC
jgi:hypothetical protein